MIMFLAKWLYAKHVLVRPEHDWHMPTLQRTGSLAIEVFNIE